MARPRDIEKQDIHTLVLEKSKNLFLKEGYDNITMRRIANEIGYTPGTIYLYFKNKEEILFELHNEGFKLLYQYKKSTISAGSINSLERLRSGGVTYIKFAIENPEYYEVMFNMPEPRDYLEDLRKKTQSDESSEIDYAMKSYNFLKEEILACMNEGYFKNVDPDVATFSFWSYAHGIASLIIRKRIPYPQQPSMILAEAAIDFFMKTGIK